MSLDNCRQNWRPRWTIGHERTIFFRPIRALFDGSHMDWPDYLRKQAIMYRQQAEQSDDPFVKAELLEFASVCEEVANEIEDHLTGG